MGPGAPGDRDSGIIPIARRAGCGPVSVGRGESQAQPWSDPSPWRLAGAGGSSHLHRGRELDRGQAGVLAQWAELGRRPAAAGGIAGRSRAGQARDGPSKGWDPAGLQVRTLQSPRAAPRDTPKLARPVAPRSSQPTEGAVVPRSLSRAGAGRKFQCYFRRGAVGWAVQLAGEGTGPAVAKPGRDRGPRNVPNRRLGLDGRCGRRNAVPARLPEDYLRVPAASGCDSGLLGHPGPRAAGAPGRVTRSLPASDPELHPFHCHYKHGGARRAVSPPDR